MSNMNYDGGWGPGIYPDQDRWRTNLIRLRHKFYTCRKCGQSFEDLDLEIPPKYCVDCRIKYNLL